MRVASVFMTSAVLEHFVIHNPGRCFGVTKGLPDDSRLLSIDYVPSVGRYLMQFTSEEFDDIDEDGLIPTLEVEYTAYQMQPSADSTPAGEEPEHKEGEAVVH